MLGLALILLAARTFVALEKLSVYKKTFSYDRVHYWVKSGKCAATTGTILAVQEDDGRLTPLEDFSPGDDYGHALVLGLISIVHPEAQGYRTLAAFNIVFNALSVVILAIVCFPFGRLLSVLVLAIGSIFCVPGIMPGPDVIAVYSGIFLFLVSAVILVARLMGDEPRLLLVLPVLIICAMCVTLRQSMGVLGMFCMLAVVMLNWRRVVSSGRHAVAAVLIVCCIPLANRSIDAVFAVRDRISSVEKAKMGVTAHGFGHNILIGLGVDGNSFGLRWEDKCGYEYIRQRYPDVTAGSRAYYEAAMREYLSLLVKNPVEVAGIYLRKLIVTSRQLGVSLAEYAVLGAVMSVLAIALLMKRQARDDVLAAVVVGTSLLVFLTIAQSVLAWTDYSFMHPAEVGFVVAWMFLVAWLRNRGWKLSFHVVASLVAVAAVGQTVFEYVTWNLWMTNRSIFWLLRVVAVVATAVAILFDLRKAIALRSGGVSAGRGAPGETVVK